MTNPNDLEASIREDVGDDADIHISSAPDEVFYTNREKLKLALIDYQNVIKSKYRSSGFISVFLTSLSVVLVADFTETFGISADLWLNIFTTVAILSLIVIVYDGFKWLINRRKAKIESVIEELRKVESDE